MATRTFLAAAGCFAVMLEMRLTLNVPINRAIFRWDEQRGGPERSPRPRRRPDRVHAACVVLDGVGSALVAGAVIWH